MPECTHQRIPIRDYKGGPPSADFAKIEEKKNLCKFNVNGIVGPITSWKSIFCIELTAKMPGFENEGLNAL